jgi:hypothetical protein
MKALPPFRFMTLLEQIQNEAVDGSSDIATTLRKCKLLSARLNDEEFAQWIAKELGGYGDAALPNYRILAGFCYGNFLGIGGAALTNVPLRESDIAPDVQNRFLTVRISEGIAAIQEMSDSARRSNGTLRFAWSADDFAFYRSTSVNRPYVLAQAWTVISHNVIVGLLSTIRDQILNFVIRIMAENPNAGEAAINSRPVDPEKASKIFHNTIHVHGNVTNLTSGNVEFQNVLNEVRPGDLESLKKFLKNAGIPDPDIVDLEEALKDEPDSASIESIPKRAKWLEGLKGKVSSGAINLTTMAMQAGAVELIKQGVDTFFSR